jgi:hypothetical protein
LNANAKSAWSINGMWEDVLSEKKQGETQRLVKAIVVLIRNTTWRCGKLERVIVRHLGKSKRNLGRPEMPVKEMLQNFKVTGKKKNEFLDAIKRLERRRIVRISSLVS